MNVSLVELVSSSLQSASFDAESLTLMVNFHDGSQYAYIGVPLSTFQQLLAAESKGRFFNQFIRTQFPYDRKN